MAHGARLAAASALVAVAIGTAGCQSVGPTNMQRDRTDYAGAIADSWKAQTLLNIARLRWPADAYAAARYRDHWFWIDDRDIHSKRAFSFLMMFASIAETGIEGYSAEPAPGAVAREIIPGSELMTSRERERYRERMRGARSPQEQAEIREGHVKRMRERARLRGLELPEPHTNTAP